jgi:hypothetical protein
MGASAHSLVVRDHCSQLVTQAHSCGQVDGIERTHGGGIEVGRAGQKIVIETDEVDTLEVTPSLWHEARQSGTPHRTKDLDL